MLLAQSVRVMTASYPICPLNRTILISLLILRTLVQIQQVLVVSQENPEQMALVALVVMAVPVA